MHEQVDDVMCSDHLARNADHRSDKPVGYTVDVKTATYTNSIGDTLLMA